MVSYPNVQKIPDKYNNTIEKFNELFTALKPIRIPILKVLSGYL